jgi:fructuronate reductase
MLSRTTSGLAAAPVRHAHLGLGNFFRAHQAYYSARASDADQWGIPAFGGRSSTLADDLAAQDGLYTLVTQAPSGNRYDVIASVSEARAADDHDAWLRRLSSPECSLATITVTEAAYLRRDEGGIDRDHPLVRADIRTLRADRGAPVTSIPGRLVAGLAARQAADAGPIAIVPCDNLMQNGVALAQILAELADDVDPALAEWISTSVSFVSSMVDRITPRTSEHDIRLVRQLTGVADACPVVTEPFTEWVLHGDFPGGRPSWEDAGAEFVDDVAPFEQRKLWLLNGAHSLLAYGGSIRGHSTVAQAIADDTCQGWVNDWWDEASGHLELPADATATYRQELVERFSNPAIVHRLDQIAPDGSQKIPVRALTVLARERQEGRIPLGTTRVLASWIVHLRSGAVINDPQRETLMELSAGSLPEAVRRLLDFLGPEVGADSAVTTTVLDQAEELARP